jgi:HSP20 family protein
MERLFDSFLGGMTGETPGGRTAAWAPYVDVSESDKELVIRADLPGVDPSEIEVTVADGKLILSGERKEQREEAGRSRRVSERAVGRFHREVPLPPGTDPDRIQARSAHGVLTITIPKKAESQGRRIKVEGA